MKLGGVERVKEMYRDRRGLRWLETLTQDVRFGIRTLGKNPGFTTVAVLTLALGIGANTAIFSMLDAVLLKAVPVRDPNQLVILQWHGHKGPRYDENSSFGDCEDGHSHDLRWGCSFSSPMFDALQSDTKGFTGLAAFAGPAQVQLSGNGPATMATAEIVSGGYFETLGVRATLGRVIEDHDDAPTSSPVAVLSYGYWQSAFGRDSSVVGHTIRLNQVPTTIIGVADPEFARLSPGKQQDMWITRWSFPRIGSHEGWSRVADPGNSWLAIIGRLEPNASRAQAQAAASLTFRDQMLHGSHPLMDATSEPAVTLIPLQEGLTGRRSAVSKPLYLLMFAVGILLLISCANVAGLLIARSASRQREIAMRLTLGAPHARIVRQLLTESVLLSACGGLVGVLFAYWGVHAFASLVSSGNSVHFVVRPDGRILAFTAAVSILSGIAFGFAPAWRATRGDLTPALKRVTGAQGRTGHFSIGNSLVVTQVALTVVALAGAGLLVRTLRNLESVDPGFDTRNVLLFAIDPPLAGYDAGRTQALYQYFQREFGALPGMTSVSYSSKALLSGNRASGDVRIENQPDKSSIDADMLGVGPSFFNTMSIRMLAGRNFAAEDFEDQATQAVSSSGSALVSVPLPVIINEKFAHDYFGQESALGARLLRGNSWGSHGDLTANNPTSHEWTVIGVAADAKYDDLRAEIAPTIYFPQSGGGAYFELRTTAAPESLVPAVRQIVTARDSDLPVFSIATESHMVENGLSQQTLVAKFSGFFGLLALLLASTGLYGLLAYEVTRGTREIGIRMALGEQPSHTLRKIVGGALLLAGGGVAVGVVIALALTRFLESLLFGVKPSDPATFIATAIVLLTVAMVACWIPARRAMRVDPMVALRHE